MLRKLTILLMSLTLCCTTIACSSPASRSQYSNQSQNRSFDTTSSQTQLSSGQYPVQQATYDDSDGEYSLMLLNTPAGSPPTFRTTNLQMARLTEEDIKSGKKSYLNLENGQAALYLTEDFKIQYVHNVTENRTNPQTGENQTVVVRQESNFWTPFAGAVAGNIAGQVIGNMLFRPQYYVPPVYGRGPLVGYGGYGSSYGQAVNQYQTRYQAPPAAVTNRQAFRTTGRLNSPSYNQPTTERRVPQEGNRSTGSGYGSSTLRQSGRSSPSGVKRSTGFGSSGRSRVGGGRRR